MPRNLQNPRRHDQLAGSLDGHNPSKDPNPRGVVLHARSKEVMKHNDQTENLVGYRPARNVQSNSSPRDGPQRPAQQVSGERNEDQLSEEDIEVVKHLARERYETFYEGMMLWDHFATGLNGSMQRAHEFLSRGEYDKARQVFERVVRTVDEFLRNHSS